MTTEQMLLTAVGGLSTAVLGLFALLVQVYRAVEKRLLDCETDREKLWERITQIENGGARA